MNAHHTTWSWISVIWPGLHTTACTENVASACRVCRTYASAEPARSDSVSSVVPGLMSVRASATAARPSAAGPAGRLAVGASPPGRPARVVPVLSCLGPRSDRSVQSCTRSCCIRVMTSNAQSAGLDSPPKGTSWPSGRQRSWDGSMRRPSSLPRKWGCDPGASDSPGFQTVLSTLVPRATTLH